MGKSHGQRTDLADGQCCEELYDIYLHLVDDVAVSSLSFVVGLSEALSGVNDLAPVAGFCGDATVYSGEECDDGGIEENDGCDENCRLDRCGQPISDGPLPVATDALHALRSSVRLETCPACVCDANGDSRTTATDALVILIKALGGSVDLACPPVTDCGMPGTCRDLANANFFPGSLDVPLGYGVVGGTCTLITSGQNGFTDPVAGDEEAAVLLWETEAQCMAGCPPVP